MALWVRRNADWNKGRRNIKHDRDLEYLIIRLFKALNGRGHKWVPSLPVVLIFLRLYFHIFNPLHDIWKGCNFRVKPWFLKFSKFYAFYIFLFFFHFYRNFPPKKEPDIIQYNIFKKLNLSLALFYASYYLMIDIQLYFVLKRLFFISFYNRYRKH